MWAACSLRRCAFAKLSCVQCVRCVCRCVCVNSVCACVRVEEHSTQCVRVCELFVCVCACVCVRLRGYLCTQCMRVCAPWGAPFHIAALSQNSRRMCNVWGVYSGVWESTCEVCMRTCVRQQRCSTISPMSHESDMGDEACMMGTRHDAWDMRYAVWGVNATWGGIRGTQHTYTALGIQC